MKKSTIQQIKLVGQPHELPQMRQIVNQYARLKGEELKKNGLSTLKDGTIVDDGKIYISFREALHRINHVRRMKKQYKRYGMAGVIGYRRAVLAYAEAEANKKQTDGKAH